MTFSKIGRIVMALVASAALGLGMTACGGGTIGYLWVTGTFYNQISGFKIDDYTGNLTQIEHSPFTSGGSSPSTIVVKTGGRFVYVVNSGTGLVGAPGQAGYAAPTGSAISEFSVGGDGVLTFQQNFFSQGTHPLWATFDSTGTFLYVLDEYSPNYGQAAAGGGIDLNGSITAFTADPTTGRLSLVPNNSVLNPNGSATNVFEVGPNPIMSKIGSGSCLFTLSAGSIFPYVISSTGQLTVTTTGPLVIQSGTSTAPSLTSINTSVGSSASSFIYLTDGANNQIYSYSAPTGTGCTLSPIAASDQQNVAANVIPVNSLTSSNGKFLYVLNTAATGTNQAPAQSSISAYNILSTGALTPLADPTSNPYAVGSGPVCAAEDPTNQYMYVSNNTDSTLTGKLLNQTTGFLSDLSHGSVFGTTQNPTCLAVSGNI